LIPFDLVRKVCSPAICSKTLPLPQADTLPIDLRRHAQKRLCLRNGNQALPRELKGSAGEPMGTRRQQPADPQTDSNPKCGA